MKKNFEALIAAETEAEIDRILERLGPDETIDFEAWEFFVRAAVLSQGAKALERLVEGVGAGRQSKPVVCRCGGKMDSQGLKAKTITTVVGPVGFSRSLYTCPRCHAARFPGDERLGVVETSFSPGAQRMMARAGSRDSYREAAENLNLYAKLEITGKDVERVAKRLGAQVGQWMQRQGAKAQLYEAAGMGQPEAGDAAPILYISFDGTGVPMRSEELTGVKGKQSDGSARTREVKLGCVFTQTGLDKQGRPLRDPASTTYTGAIEDSQRFGVRIAREALRRGVSQAGKVVCLTDGAKYNKTIIAEHFPEATHVIDLYHAREKLCEVSKLLLAESEREEREKQWLALLDQGAIESLVGQISAHTPRSGTRRKEVLKRVGYFKDNAPQMRYGQFRAQKLFIGSGVIEAGCKTLIGKRLKNSGMFWSRAGANAVIALRCCQYSGRFEQFWEDAAG